MNTAKLKLNRLKSCANCKHSKIKNINTDDEFIFSVESPIKKRGTCCCGCFRYSNWETDAISMNERWCIETYKDLEE